MLPNTALFPVTMLEDSRRWTTTTRSKRGGEDQTRGGRWASKALYSGGIGLSRTLPVSGKREKERWTDQNCAP